MVEVSRGQRRNQNSNVLSLRNLANQIQQDTEHHKENQIGEFGRRSRQDDGPIVDLQQRWRKIIFGVAVRHGEEGCRPPHDCLLENDFDARFCELSGRNNVRNVPRKDEQGKASQVIEPSKKQKGADPVQVVRVVGVFVLIIVVIRQYLERAGAPGQVHDSVIAQHGKNSEIVPGLKVLCFADGIQIRQQQGATNDVIPSIIE